MFSLLLRIVVVGEGREKFGHVFLADTGTSNGDITGQTRPINTVGTYFIKFTIVRLFEVRLVKC